MFVEKTKAQIKKEERLKRQLQKERKKKVTRTLVWTSSAIIVALLVVLIIFWPKPAPVAFDYDKIPTLGSPDAKVKLVEFGDFKCPTCAWFSKTMLSQLKADSYIDNGDVSFSYQNWTIIYEDSITAALAGLAIYHQNNEEFWKFYDYMYENQQPEEFQVWATPDYLVNAARAAGLNIDFDLLRKDIEEQTYIDELNRQNALARSLNLSGTPTLFLNGERLDWETTSNYEKLKAAIEKALKEASA